MSGHTFGCRRCGHSKFVYTTVIEHHATGDDLAAWEDEIVVADPGDLSSSMVDSIYRCATCGLSRRDARKLVTGVRRV